LVDTPQLEAVNVRPALATRSPVAELDQRLHVDEIADAIPGLDTSSPFETGPGPSGQPWTAPLSIGRAAPAPTAPAPAAFVASSPVAPVPTVQRFMAASAALAAATTPIASATAVPSRGAADDASPFVARGAPRLDTQLEALAFSTTVAV